MAFSVCQALFCYGQTASDTVDVNEKTFMLSGPGAVFGKGIYEASPAASLYRYGVSYTEIGASYRMRDENEALLMQLGDRFDAGAFTADSWLRLDSASAAFASVEYVNGRTAGVLWNSSSDFLLLYPYVTADTVGAAFRMKNIFSPEDIRAATGLSVMAFMAHIVHFMSIVGLIRVPAILLLISRRLFPPAVLSENIFLKPLSP